MKPLTIKLPKGNYISDIEPFKTHGIPVDAIILKPTGSGITEFAIKYFFSNLILIEPNVPVIESKVREHNRTHPANMQIIGVHKGIDTLDIKAYLLGEAKYKKILTTPEGFISKVMKAFADDLELLYSDYFILFDECERIITDVSYRGAIAAPLDEFFKFKHKALVSATTLPFSDERFDEFIHYTIQPAYDYSKPLTVIPTNHVAGSLKKQLEKLNSEHVCIFFNSTVGIASIVKTLNIDSQSKTYCAQESVVKLLTKQYRHATSDLDTRTMPKYSLFTSRYFSAVDIKLDYRPDVIILTDAFFADHSIIDPHTEAIQIAGRFRNGINSLTHITNFNPNLDAKGEDETRYYLQGCFDTYNWFVTSHENATHQGSKDMFKSAIDASPVNSFYNNGKLNSFMIDNAVQEERVKGYYQRFNKLKEAYEELRAQFYVHYSPEEYPVSDADLLTLNSRQTIREKYKTVAELFEKYTSTINNYVLARLTSIFGHRRTFFDMHQAMFIQQ